MWVREIVWIEPIEAARSWADLPGLSFLDSAMPHPALGRYSTLATEPFGIFHVEDGTAFWNDEPVPGAPLDAMRDVLARYPVESYPDFPPFQGGAIGIFSYEFGWLLDRDRGHELPLSGRVVEFGFYDIVLSFDHRQRRCWLMASGWPAPTPGERQERAAARLDLFVDRLRRLAPSRRPAPQPLRWQTHVTKDGYRTGIDRVKEYIKAGDIYQANVAQRFTAAVPAGTETFPLYEQLRAANPAPFAAYLRCGSRTVLSSSPERFVRLRGREVETRPIKGTAPRAAQKGDDDALAETLLGSEKDRAENTMIVDLLRNDLSRVCEPHSVAVPVLCGLETYASVHHLVSVVTGRLRAGLDALDLVGASFPGGSITGAPKLRAMEIIQEIEATPRGVYCGAIGAIGFDGFADFNIAIRTVVIEDGVATLQAGGGITILSDADAEYRETLVKAQRIFEAFTASGAPDGVVPA